MANIIRTVIQFRRDRSENWLIHKDIVPGAGEPCFETDTGVFKIGDGKTTYEHLTAINGAKVEFSADGKSIVLEDNVFKLMGFDDAETGAQLTKNANGDIEWVVPSNEVVDGLQTSVDGLQLRVTDLQNAVESIQEIIAPSADGAVPLVSRIEDLETKMDGTGDGTVDAKIDAKINEFATKISDDGTVNTLKELIDYVSTHGDAAAGMATDVAALKELVGTTPVSDQIIAAINGSGHVDKDEAEATYEHVKYEISHKPVGTLVDYRDQEIRVMVPADHKWEKQSVGASGNSNMYYMGFKAYAPYGAASFKEGDRGVIIDKMFTFDDDFAGTDEYGRNYSICWLALASYDASSDTWTYFGKNSSVDKYIGWDYIVEWYNADGVVIASDCVRINLSNENCHYFAKPYYVGSMMKEIDSKIEEKITEVNSVYEVVEF